MKKEFGKYYLGLDIGTDSVGWAVTDQNYNILEFNRKAMWGIHLFDSGETAEKRRVFRCSRRRLERRKQRISLIRELFDEEICKFDPLFFERLDESKFYMEDKTNKQHNTLFNDPNFKDKDLHKKYPSIYHLRHDMMNTKDKPDIRLVYLAIHHIIKYRGHFLFEGISSGKLPKFSEIFSKLLNDFNNNYDSNLCADNTMSEVEELILDKELGIREKKASLYSLLSAEEQSEKALADLLVGSIVSLDKLFEDPDFKDIKFSFKDSNFDDKADEYEDALGSERMITVKLMKQVYDWSILARLLKDSKYISEAKIKEYNQHRNDLKDLKSIIKRLVPEKYNEVFKSSNIDNNYSSYVKVYKNDIPSVKSCSQEDFCKYIKSILKNQDVDSDKQLSQIFKRLEDNSFMPKQTSKENSIIPYILHREELSEILNNVSTYYPFLNKKDESTYSVKEKILMIDKFRIPYYVGPLDDRSDEAWLVRKSNEKVTPWNFEDIIDVDESSQRFIDRLTNYCTYLRGEKVLPKNSILYSRFELYNELNAIKINGEKISSELKNSIFKDLFEDIDRVKKVKKKDIEKYLASQCIFSNSDEITGIDIDIKSSLKSHIQIKGIINDKINDRRMVDEVIRCITIFGDDSSRLKKKLQSDFSDKLSEEEIKKLSSLRFEGWGRLSEKFLIGISHKDRATGEATNIMTALERTNSNLMELLSNDFTYTKQIDEINSKMASNDKNGITYGLVKDLYVSPAVKRGIWRTLNIVKDIIKITGCPPEKVFIETTRENRDKKRTVSRKDKLMELFKTCKDQERDWASEISGMEEGKLRGKKLYSYYIQHGKCMYCNENIDINDINEKYDMDHICPQSKVKDDSIHNNMVLVCKTCNQNKGDTYPLSAEIQNKMRVHWSYLKEKNFITGEKHSRLIRSTEFTDEELTGFISRQLVETSQSVKAVANVLKSVFGKESKIVYVKGKSVSDFRNDDKCKFIKCRSVNDYHHAKDAYLNIVVGNVHHVKFTENTLLFVKGKEKYNLNKMYSNDVKRNNEVAWISGDEGTILTIKKYMNRNNILFTRFATQNKGQLYDINMVKKGKDKFPIKKGMDTEKYGGYNKESGAYFSLIEHNKKGKIVRTLETVPIHIISNNTTEKDIVNYFSEVKGLKNSKIIIPNIKFKSTFEIDGFRLNISGRTGNQIIYTCGVQLILSNVLYDYCKKISNHQEKSKEAKKILPGSYYKLTPEDNLSLYDEMLSKLKNTNYGILSPFNTHIKTFESKRPIFIEKSIEVQSKILNEFLHIFKCNSTLMNIEEIGGSKYAGKLLLSNNVSTFKSVKIIHQSPSGLFEKEIDAMKI